MKIYSYSRLINTVLILSLLVAALIVVISVGQTRRIDHTNSEILHTQQSLAALNKITNSILEVQSSNRAYLLTKDNQFLLEADSLKSAILESLTWLQSKGDFTFANARYLRELVEIIQRRFSISDEIIEKYGLKELQPAELAEIFNQSKLLEKRSQQICNALWLSETEKLKETELNNVKGLQNLNIILYINCSHASYWNKPV
ncbi:MAG: CHASE3 domain-containing protein [Chitinophagaceae bacterium]|nr:CHASE3 domain-containing protein [Chitinophagaceae bacterium]